MSESGASDDATPSGIVPRLAMVDITKAWPGVVANDGVCLAVGSGEIHGLIGENGAGKSTLMKIACGLLRPDAGRLLWDGNEIAPASPRAARALGIGMVFQHFSLFDSLNVTENVALALPGVAPDAALAARIEACGSRYGLPVNATASVHDLSVGERQRVEIIRCLLFAPRLLILDEPTSVLTPQAIAGLFETLRTLAGEGTSILYISHKLHEVRTLCSRATVMRGGRVVGEYDPRAVGEAVLSRAMLDALPAPLARATGAVRGAIRLACSNLLVPAQDALSTAVHIDDLQVQGGEIVGIAGVSGNGQNEILDLLSGERLLTGNAAAAASLSIAGNDVRAQGVWARRRLGLAFIPEERIGRGSIPGLSLAMNTLLTHRDRTLVRRGWLQKKALRRLADRVINAFGVKARDADVEAGKLSGGNLQKFIVGRELIKQPVVLLVAQPTWGVDVGAAAMIHQSLLDLRAGGAAIVVVSEDLDELFELCDAICVVARGRLSERIPRERCSPALIGRLMGGMAVAP